MTNNLQAYTYGRLVAVVEGALTDLPSQFAEKAIRMPLGFFTHWLKEAALRDGPHQKMLESVMNDFDGDIAFPANMTAVEQSQAWIGYNRERSDDARIRLGARIAQLRKAKGMSQLELAALTGINNANISKIEAGRYNVSVDVLERIAKALNAEITMTQE